jgi:hypothetical protein
MLSERRCGNPQWAGAGVVAFAAFGGQADHEPGGLLKSS